MGELEHINVTQHLLESTRFISASDMSENKISNNGMRFFVHGTNDAEELGEDMVSLLLAMCGLCRGATGSTMSAHPWTASSKAYPVVAKIM